MVCLCDTGSNMLLFGNSVRHLEITTSTNALLKAEAEAGVAQEGAVVVAEHQTTGRGRFDRRWEAPPGKALLFSVLLKPIIESGQVQLIGLMVSMAVLDGLIELSGSETRDGSLLSLTNRDSFFQLKWPNDILADGRKLCGILCETGANKKNERFVVAGIGLNINQETGDFPPELRKTATSLYIITGKTQSREKLLGLILKRLERYYHKLNREGTDWIAATWMMRACLEGSEVTVTERNRKLTGICSGLKQDGALMLQMPDGSVRVIYSGDIS